MQVLQANPQVADDAGRVAVQRGPLVYCMEELDQPAGVTMSDLAVCLGQKPQAEFQSEKKNDLLGGVVVLRHTGMAYDRVCLSQGSVFALRRGSGTKPPGSTDIYSLLCLVKPSGDFDAGLDSGG